jgi:hypothetical protein
MGVKVNSKSFISRTMSLRLTNKIPCISKRRSLNARKKQKLNSKKSSTKWLVDSKLLASERKMNNKRRSTP